jgi:hypothetical protein
VTRCKSETASRRYQRNGYAPELTGIQSNRLYFVSEYALHEIFTKPPRQFARANMQTVINGNAASDRATFAHRASPGAENWPTEGRAPLYFLKLQLPMGPKTTWQTRTP